MSALANSLAKSSPNFAVINASTETSSSSLSAFKAGECDLNIPPRIAGMRILVSGDLRRVEKDWGIIVRPSVPGIWRYRFFAAGEDFGTIRSED